MEKILIIDDEKSILDLLSVVFKKEGYRVRATLSAKKALELLNKEEFGLILTDIKLPEMSGFEILKRVRESKPDIAVVMITAYGNVKQAVEALKAGAFDYVVKPFDVDELKIIVAKALEKKRLQEENILLRKELKEKSSFETVIGKSKKIKQIYSMIEKIAGTDSTILVTGESGTGKELAARAIHSLSPREENRFVSINCGALPENLLESELFGHVEGAFTGAVADKVGLFEVAQRGTLFLDEVGEMAPWTQVKLLRTLQDKKIRRVGGTEEAAIDVRIIAATNQDLKKKISEGKFREDLFYRLNVISFEMPPLRERKEDVPLFVNHFLKKYSMEIGKSMKRITPDVMKLFESYPWPGNIRELENVIERTVAIEDRETITLDSLPDELLTARKREETDLLFQKNFCLTSFLDEAAQSYIKQARLLSGGNLKKTASLLGISYRNLRYLIDKYKLKTDQETDEKDAKANQKPLA
ncbi:MAG: sigma-54 dependent transcriptional regulator [Candidatus Aminicenantaceae bacterium]